MTTNRFRAQWTAIRLDATAVTLVAATYVFFLLFAQFGFLHGIRSTGLGAAMIHSVLAVMAVTGVGASLATPRLIRRHGAGRVVAIGQIASAGGAALAALVFRAATPHPGPLVLTAAMTGGGIGLATVALAADLRRLTGGRAIGLKVGAGTGMAYATCNVPAVFHATPAAQAALSAAVALGAAAMAMAVRERGVDEAQRLFAAARSGARRGAWATNMAAVVAAFFALVWFDSAAFAAVHLSAELRAALWETPGALIRLGAVHAAAAVCAGAWLDRAGWRTPAAIALGLLVFGAFAMLRGGVSPVVASSAYAAGVSIYSTALAAFAALGPEASDERWSRARRAALLYAIAGWIGSAAGVGLAEQFGGLPDWAPAVAIGVFAMALAAPQAAIIALRRREEQA